MVQAQSRNATASRVAPLEATRRRYWRKTQPVQRVARLRKRTAGPAAQRK
jgi:hypothetical protein